MTVQVPVPIAALTAQVAAQLNGSQLLGIGIAGGVVAPNGIAGARGGTLGDWRAETVSVTQFGARGDAVVVNGVLTSPGQDDTAAFVLAFGWLSGAPGRLLVLPAGTYNLASLAAPLAMPSGATLRGAGMHRSRIVWNDTAGFDLFATTGTAAVPVTDIAFEDFTVTGSCATHWGAAQGGYPFLLTFAQGVAIRRVCSEWSRAMGMALRVCSDVVIDHPWVRYTAFDGISVSACENVTISGAVVEWTDDDAISWHSDVEELAPHGTLVLTGFRIRCTGGGIDALGAKHCVISDGVLELVRFQGISVGGQVGASEGLTSTYGVSISNVVIRDMLDGALAGNGNAGCRALCVNSTPPQAGGLGAPPGLNAAGGSVVVPIAGGVDGNGNNAGTAIAIGSGVTVANMHVLVGRKPVSAYSGYGMGAMFTRHGWIDPAVPVTALQPVALTCLSGVIRDLRLHNCVFEGGGGAVGLFLAAGVRLAACEMIGCTFRDFAGVLLQGNGVRQDVAMLGGIVDLDPYLVAPGRAVVGGRTDGSWQAGAMPGQPILVQGNGAGGFVFSSVSLRNLYAVQDGATPDVGFDGCRLRCAPANVGYDPGNKGIGVVPAAGAGFVLVLEDADPGSATFGQTQFVPSLDMPGQPTSGTWLAAQFVRNAAPAVANGKLVLGWTRLTTGADNSAASWAPAVTTIS